MDIAACKVESSSICFYIFCIYIPPDISSLDFEHFLNQFEQLICNFDRLIIFGDFNVPDFLEANLNSAKFNAINNFMSMAGLKQCNNIVNINGRMLDLCFCRNVDIVTISEDSQPLVNVDIHHPALNVVVKISKTKANNFPLSDNAKLYNFKKANFQGLYNEMCLVDWSFLSSIEDVNSCCSAFYVKLYNILDKFVPQFKSHKNNFPKWYSAELKHYIHAKKYYFNKYKRSNDRFYYYEFAETRRIVKSLLRRDYNNYLQTVQHSLSDDPRYFWKFVKEKKTTTIPGTLTYNDIELTNPVDIVNNFSKYFASVFNKNDNLNSNGNIKDNNLQSTLNTKISNEFININFISESDIKQAIKELKANFTCGLDRIPSFFIKDCSPVLIEPLLILFNKCINCKIFPDVWKSTRVCPVYKSGGATDIKNYRPISILCNFAKVFERIIYNYIYLSVSNQVSTNQHGFLAGRSTVTNLITVTQFLSEELDKGNQVDVIYTDISKAFDKIIHSLLLNKLRNFGFSDSLVTFFQSYLSNRQQTVCFNGFLSPPFTQISGIPQGSNLGPLLFLIYINDLTEAITNSSFLLFADDLKIYKAVNSHQDYVDLQADLDSVLAWCQHNGLYLNINKCSVVSFTRKIKKHNFQYYINRTLIDRKDVIKDLGITFDSKLSFNEHISVIVNASYKTLGFIIRNVKSFNNLDAIKSLYFSLVRSKLEYGSIIWSPFYINSSLSLEKVQRRFLKFLSFRAHNYYPESRTNQITLLNEFEIDSLKSRRMVASTVFMHKILHNNIDCKELLSSIDFHVPRTNSRFGCDFKLKTYRTNIGLKSPLYVMAKHCNSLGELCDIFADNLNKVVSCAKEKFGNTI